jgi:hypothetical protein
LACGDISHGLDARGDATVQAYLDEGWIFNVARLRRDEAAGYARPHPIVLRFPAAQPVYPMRLTQLAGGDLHLDLFVFAAERAEIEGLETKTCIKNKFRSSESATWLHVPEWAARSAEAGVITHLSANLGNGQLNRDFPVTFRSFQPAQAKVWLPEGLRWTMLERSLLVFSVLLFCGALWRHYETEGDRPRRGLRVFVFIGVALSLAMVIHCYVYCPRGQEIERNASWDYRVHYPMPVVLPNNP